MHTGTLQETEGQKETLSVQLGNEHFKPRKSAEPKRNCHLATQKSWSEQEVNRLRAEQTSRTPTKSMSVLWNNQKAVSLFFGTLSWFGGTWILWRPPGSSRKPRRQSRGSQSPGQRGNTSSSVTYFFVVVSSSSAFSSLAGLSSSSYPGLFRLEQVSFDDCSWSVKKCCGNPPSGSHGKGHATTKTSQSGKKVREGRSWVRACNLFEAKSIDLTSLLKADCGETWKIWLTVAWSHCSQTGERPRNFSMSLLCQNRLFSSLK